MARKICTAFCSDYELITEIDDWRKKRPGKIISFSAAVVFLVRTALGYKEVVDLTTGKTMLVKENQEVAKVA